MIRSFFYFILNSFFILLCWIKGRAFYKYILNDVAKAQEGILLKILKANKKSEFGKRYNFLSITSVESFQSMIPLSTYDSYLPYIRSILDGKKRVLTEEPISIFALSSGSASASKHIPYTKSLKKEFQKAIAPWILNLYLQRKEILFGNAYWSISPVKHKNKMSKAGIPIGFEDDSEYFGWLEKFLLKYLRVTPKEISEIQDITSFRYVTLLFLLRARNLTFISVWSPSFLTILLQSLLEQLPLLISDIENGTISVAIKPELKNKLLPKLSRDTKRAKELRGIFLQYEENKPIGPICEKIWPNLAMISCWTDGNSALCLEAMMSYFPNIEVQGKGLFATEGFVSFPLVGEAGCILSIKSHFFEFITSDKMEGNNKIKLAHELEIGKRYSVIITTSGGLYRYRLQDIIEVTGFKGQCPLIRFVSKEDKISDLCGEKLNEFHINGILSKLFDEHSFSPSFSMLAPEEENGSYSYVLFLELKDKKNGFNSRIFTNLVAELEAGLGENYHYSYCRELGQLLKARIFLIENNAIEVYNNVCRLNGQKEGDIKISTLDSRAGWAKKFKGLFLN